MFGQKGGWIFQNPVWSIYIGPVHTLVVNFVEIDLVAIPPVLYTDNNCVKQNKESTGKIR